MRTFVAPANNPGIEYFRGILDRCRLFDALLDMLHDSRAHFHDDCGPPQGYDDLLAECEALRTKGLV